jgi:hypothetical protein
LVQEWFGAWPGLVSFRVSDDNRELYESAKFKFSLGGVNWSGRYAQPAQRLNA